jgi:hypothetical protein
MEQQQQPAQEQKGGSEKKYLPWSVLLKQKAARKQIPFQHYEQIFQHFLTTTKRAEGRK